MKTLLHRYLILLTLAFWMGGFTFYTGVVIGIGNHVLGSERDIGFITQQVTLCLNWIGIVTLIILAWGAWQTRIGTARLLLILSWLGMAITELGLFWVHHALDNLLETSTHKIHGHMDTFFNWHRLYMMVATMQWSCALVYLWLILMLWRQADGQATPNFSAQPTAEITIAK